MSRLEKWVKSVGVAKLADKLGVDKSTIGYWLRRHTVPGLITSLKIVKLSQGQVTLNDIVRATCKK